MKTFVRLFTRHSVIFFAVFLVSHFGAIAQCDSLLFLGNDTLLCEEELLILDATFECADLYEWQNGSTNPLFMVSDSGSYSCTASILDSNLVSNGDFQLGNTLFTTVYTLGTGGPWGTLSNEGTYAITTNPNLVHNNFSSCGDHTTGTGNMMVVNGSTVNNLTVWSQVLDVEPNTNYLLEVWLISCVSDNPGSLRFAIDGVYVGSSFSSGSTTCSWQQFTEEWNSGTSTSITFSIRSQGGFAGGNDYALDDIAFSAMTQFSDTILVDYQDLANLDLGPDTSLCEVQMLGLNAYVENAEYLWQDSSDLSFFNVFQEGLYWVDVSHGVCVQTDSIYVNYNYIYDNFLGNDSNFCVSDSIVLTMDIDYATYLWSDSTTSNQFIITEEGAYWLEVSVGNCVESDTINIDDSAILAIDFGPDTSVCIGETILLDAGNPGASFLWQDQSTNETYLVEEEGLYSVEVGSGSCSFYGEIFVAYYDPPDIDLGDDESICIGSSLELGVALDDLSYLWQDNSQDSIFIVDEAGLYWLQVVHEICAYVSSDSIVIDLEPYPYLYLGPDTTICVGTVLTIGSDFFGASFEWQDGSIGPLFTVEEDGLYWLNIENQCGTARDSIFIEYIDCECPFYMPNSFTPNGDLDNDYFPPNYQCNFLEFYFVIYDRWGSVVFETNDPYAQWDGNIDGQPAPMGVYPYAFQFLHFIEYRKGSGFVTLLR